jgi:hypothetical protein
VSPLHFDNFTEHLIAGLPVDLGAFAAYCLQHDKKDNTSLDQLRTFETDNSTGTTGGGFSGDGGKTETLACSPGQLPGNISNTERHNAKSGDKNIPREEFSIPKPPSGNFNYSTKCQYLVMNSQTI